MTVVLFGCIPFTHYISTKRKKLQSSPRSPQREELIIAEMERMHQFHRVKNNPFVRVVAPGHPVSFINLTVKEQTEIKKKPCHV